MLTYFALGQSICDWRTDWLALSVLVPVTSNKTRYKEGRVLIVSSAFTVWLQGQTLQGTSHLRWMAEMLMLIWKSSRIGLNGQQNVAITIQTLITLYPLCTSDCFRLGLPVSVALSPHQLWERLWWQRFGLPLDVYILQTQGRMRGERGKEGDRVRITYSCSAAAQSPPRLRASGHGHSILWLTSEFRVVFMRGVASIVCGWVRGR